MRLSKVLVPWNIRLGAVGEAAIKSRLAYFSNPTKYEKDTGIDFYCELIEADSPSIPFYVQAKGTEHFDSSWGRGIPKRVIMYWLQQQHPVFLIVYDDETATCYWMSIEDHRYSLMQRFFATGSDTIHIKVDQSHILERGQGKHEVFIAKVKEDSLSIQLFRGHPQFIGEEYVKRIPPRPRSDHEFQLIKERVRAGLYSLVQHFWATNDVETAYTYCKFLADFDKSHYNHFAWLGQISSLLGRLDIARQSYEEALRICEADKTWPQDSMNEIIGSIKEELRRLEASGL
jgi:hypothetical protein